MTTIIRPKGAIETHRQRKAVLAEPEKHDPVILAFARTHAASAQLKVADAITAFAGSMSFVYIHVVLFAAWILFFEKAPWPTLTLIVSLEAIFLSTFVMIGQNRQSAFQQAKADHEFNTEQKELDENTELTREIHRLTVEMHALQAAIAKQQGVAGTDPTS